MAKAGEPDLQGWVEEMHRNAINIADMLGVPPEIYTGDPIRVIPALEDYVSRAPLDEFEEPDWITLHVDLVSFVADFLIQTYGARWLLVDDSASTTGYRYVVEAAGYDGLTRRIDPIDIVAKEFVNRPIEIVRMLASAELTLGLASEAAED